MCTGPQYHHDQSTHFQKQHWTLTCTELDPLGKTLSEPAEADVRWPRRGVIAWSCRLSCSELSDNDCGWERLLLLALKFRRELELGNSEILARRSWRLRRERKRDRETERHAEVEREREKDFLITSSKLSKERGPMTRWQFSTSTESQLTPVPVHCRELLAQTEFKEILLARVLLTNSPPFSAVDIGESREHSARKRLVSFCLEFPSKQQNNVWKVQMEQEEVRDSSYLTNVSPLGLRQGLAASEAQETFVKQLLSLTQSCSSRLLSNQPVWKLHLFLAKFYLNGVTSTSPWSSTARSPRIPSSLVMLSAVSLCSILCPKSCWNWCTWSWLSWSCWRRLCGEEAGLPKKNRRHEGLTFFRTLKMALG